MSNVDDRQSSATAVVNHSQKVRTMSTCGGGGGGGRHSKRAGWASEDKGDPNEPVVPRSCVSQWPRQIDKWCHTSNAMQYLSYCLSQGLQSSGFGSGGTGSLYLFLSSQVTVCPIPPPKQ